VRPRMYEPLEPRDVVAEEREEHEEHVATASNGLELLERRPHLHPAHELDAADTVVLLGDELKGIDGDAAVAYTRSVVERGQAPRHLHVGLLGRAVAPRLLVAVGVAGDVEELSGFVKSRVVVSVNGGGATDDRADVVLRGDAVGLVSALLA
jgi:electron transfer flavoprotein alpha subunit